MAYDYHTADNSPLPHIKVYDTDNEATICTIPIKNGEVGKAEMFAKIFVEALSIMDNNT